MYKYAATFLLFLFSSGANANTVCVGHYVGNNVGFTSTLVGDQFNKLSVKTYGQWNGGGQLSFYKSTQSVAGWTTYSVAVPKKVSLPNDAGELIINSPNNNVITVPTNDKWQAVFVQQIQEGCAFDTGGAWQEIMAGIRPGSVDLNLSGRGLPSGSYRLDIPYVLAWGTSESGDAYRDFQNTWKAGNVGVSNVTGYFSIEFVVKNRCEISSSNEIVLKHGIMKPSEVKENQVVSDEVSVSCEIPTPVTFQFHPQKVELGNGVSSQLALDFLGRRYIDKTMPVIIHNDKFSVISTLNGQSDLAGELYGTSVLTMLYD